MLKSFLCSIASIGITAACICTSAQEVQQKQLYSTDFSEWGAYETKAKKSVTEVSWATKYSKENLTFSVYNTQIGASNFNTGKFPDWDGGMLMCAKSDDPYITTSPLASVTVVDFVHGATGSKRGWALWAKGDGDADWVLISDAVANPASGAAVHAEVNRTNCALKFTNINASQNAYLMSLDIYGNVDMSATPMLASFCVNGTTVNAAEIFEEDNAGNMAATIEVSKTLALPSAGNPLSDIVADNGEVGEISYAQAEGSCVVTIPVSSNGSTINYVATFVYKPDFTLSYYNVDGALIGKQTVEKDAPISAFAYDADQVTVGTGQKFRGWHAEAKGGRKFAADDAVTSDLPLYAIVTDIEGNDGGARYDYNLTDRYFYVDDHEAFNPQGGEYHDGTHGWSFGATNAIDIKVAGDAYIMAYVCRYTNSEVKFSLYDGEGKKIDEAEAYDATDGKSKAMRYIGPAATLRLVADGGYYLHRLAIMNVSESPMERNAQGYYMVIPGDVNSLLNAIDLANATSTPDTNTYIFIPDGTYDLGSRVLTNISGDNISLIGQSMQGTVIVNTPEAEGIGVTATIFNTGRSTYIQDLTLQNAYPYYTPGFAGRAVCLQDKGTHTICKNVRMLSYQDTYYSNAAAPFYWETSDIHGTVDFICGDGDVVFNKCTLTVEPRNADGSGECTLTAPYTSTPTGYVFLDCTIDSKAAKYNFGRAWGGKPKCAYINTTLLQPSRLNANRWTAAGMNVAADRFAEYNTIDTDGNVISPDSKVIKFTKDKTVNEIETILTPEEAAAYNLQAIYGEWTPQSQAEQVKALNATISDGKISWTANVNTADYNYALVIKDGKIYGMWSGSCPVDDANAKWSVRLANMRGGFGPVCDVEATTGISDFKSDSTVTESVYYNLQGIRVADSHKGTAVRVDTHADGATTVTKIMR